MSPFFLSRTVKYRLTRLTLTLSVSTGLESSSLVSGAVLTGGASGVGADGARATIGRERVAVATRARPRAQERRKYMAFRRFSMGERHYAIQGDERVTTCVQSGTLATWQSPGWHTAHL